MGKLKLIITFHGGKADEHQLSIDTLAKTFSAISSDIKNVYRMVSHADVEVSAEQINEESKLFLSAEPAAGSLKLYFVSAETENDWIEVSGREYAKGLRLIGAGGGLSSGVSKSVLEHAKLFSSPKDGEYESMELTVSQDAEPDLSVVFNERYSLAVERQLVALKTLPPEIHGHEIEGILHALDDQDYTKPYGPVLLKVASYDGDWLCEIEKQRLPVDLNSVWGKRVFMRGFATFRPRKKTLRVSEMEILPDRPGLLDAVGRFIEINEKIWEGQDPTEYLDRVRESH